MIKTISTMYSKKSHKKPSCVGDMSFSELFRDLGAMVLDDCAPLPYIEGLEGLRGDNLALSQEIFMDTMQLWVGEEKGSICMANPNCIGPAYVYAIRSKIKIAHKDSDLVMQDLVDYFTEFNGKEDASEDPAEGLESHKEKADVNLNEDGTEQEEEETRDTAKETKSKKGTFGSRELSDLDKKIVSYYSNYYAGVVENLKKKYTSMFSSGYEITVPAGILTKEGIVGLSGSERKVKFSSAVTMNMYNIFKSQMGFVENASRGDKNISDTILGGYKTYANLYFPNKFLEIAYGRTISKGSGTGSNAESDKTYEKHSSSSNWSAYCKEQIGERFSYLLGVLTLTFVKDSVGDKPDATEEDFLNLDIGNKLADFLKYAENCLSTCILVVDYKARTEGYLEKVSALKVRVCDPVNTLGNHNFIKDIIEQAFLGNAGDVPFSYEPRIEQEVCVKEYAHDFNQDEALAMPLFAYKALAKLQEQGMELSWSSIILGMYSDGTILRNGTHGINLNKEITHHLIAGSRAGKGVMTLNILASGIVSKKFIFYFDDKPDMASLFRMLCPSMFVVNGDKLQAGDDQFHQFEQSRMDGLLVNTPDYALKAFNVSPSWSNLGAVVYVRALTLVTGIISARASTTVPPEELGGETGILMVVDEFNELQTAFQANLLALLENLPPHKSNWDKLQSTLRSATRKVDAKREQGKECYGDIEQQETAKVQLEKSYGVVQSYALAYAKSLAHTISYINRKRNAGFAEAENSKSDIFVISQDLGYTSTDASLFWTSLNTDEGRYKNNTVGYKHSEKLDLKNLGSVPYNMIDLKRMDAFFGRNGDTRADFLAQQTPGSKAYGKLNDKASNFAYMPSYTQAIAKKVRAQNIAVNKELADGCKYFKPFLILNDGRMDSSYVQGVFDRCSKNGVTPEQILAENPGSSPDVINPCVGFVDYIKMAGCPDVSEVLGKSGDLANYVVKAMGYQGTWEQFICDFSADWIFSIEDVVCALTGQKMPMSDPLTNPVTAESAEYCPELFGLGSVDGLDTQQEVQEGVSGYDYADLEDDEEEHEVRQNVRFNEAFNDNASFEEDQVLDLGLDDDEDDMYYEDIHESEEESFEEPHFNFDTVEDVKEGIVNDSRSGDDILKELEEMPMKSGEKDAIKTLFDFAKQLGMTAKITDEGWAFSRDLPKDEEFMKDGGYIGNHNRCTSFNQEFKYHGEIETLQDLIKIVTTDVLNLFGGVENIVSFKVIGGSIIINGYYYKCKASQMFVRDLPYDVRRQIQSGNISRLFDYGVLTQCRHLRDLEFDSRNFVYDYVSTALGMGSTVSVDRFFDRFRNLQVFTLGRKKFHRSSYLQALQEEGNDLFYQPRLSTRMADASEGVLKKAGASSWNFSKRMARSKDYGTAVKAIGVVAGAVGAMGAGMAFASSKAGRAATRGVRTLFGEMRSSFRDAIKDTNNLKD